MSTFIVATMMDRSFTPVFETSSEDEALVAREAAQRASYQDAIILYCNEEDGDYCEVLERLGAISE